MVLGSLSTPIVILSLQVICGVCFVLQFTQTGYQGAITVLHTGQRQPVEISE